MIPLETIVVPTDFSSYANHAFRYASALARQFGAKLQFVNVIDTRPLEVYWGIYGGQAGTDKLKGELKAAAEKKLAALSRKADNAGVASASTIRTGDPATEILAVANEVNANLIVIASHGHSGLEHMILGSTCEHVVRDADMPVLAVKYPEHEFVDEAGTTLKLAKVLCPYDFSSYARAALATATELCRQFGARLLLVHVVESWLDYPEFTPAVDLTLSDELAEKAKEQLDEVARGIEGVEVEARVAQGAPHVTLARLAKDDNVDLIVTATHGRSGLKRVLLGSVAERLLRQAECPVMTIRSEDGNKDTAKPKSAATKQPTAPA